VNAPAAVTAAQYLDTTRSRMTDDGCEVGWDQVGPVQALVGYRAKFVVPAMSRVHVVTSVAHFTPAAQDVAAYTRDVSTYAKHRSNSLRGMQSGVGAFAVIVQPVVVDLAAREVHTFRGRRFIGAALNGFLRRTLHTQIQPPA
jgi:hypothetical protein